MILGASAHALALAFCYSSNMGDICASFKDMRVTVMGLGLLGRGVGDIEFLANCGAHVTVTDKKTAVELKDSVERIKGLENVTLHLGGHDMRDFTNADLIIKAAGVPLNSPEIKVARDAGVPIAMSTALFAKYAMEAGAKIVGVTGTRGKSTITQMIAHSLISTFASSSRRATNEQGNASADRRANVFLGGNIRGVSTLAMLPEIKAGDIAVLELDSWQLQGFAELGISPHVAVFTNLMLDHQNYYSNMQEYFDDKAAIFRNQKHSDVLIVGASVEDKIRAANPPLDPVVPEELPKEWKLRIPGEHNRENAALAVAALQALGLSEEDIQQGLETFDAVEGRLQFVREVNGVRIFNDNNATTPEATIAGLRALGSDIVLICGGSEKGLALDELISEIRARVSHVVLLAHENYKGSARLAEVLKKEGIAFGEAKSLAGAVEAAVRKEADIILFSPAFASFGMFKNEYDRNDQFLKLVQEL